MDEVWKGQGVKHRESQITGALKRRAMATSARGAPGGVRSWEEACTEMSRGLFFLISCFFAAIESSARAFSQRITLETITKG